MMRCSELFAAALKRVRAAGLVFPIVFASAGTCIGAPVGSVITGIHAAFSNPRSTIQVEPASPKITDLFAFNGTDGYQPTGALLPDSTGALYGITSSGGASNSGVVFKLTPPSPGQTAWSEDVLHSFTGNNGDGAFPTGGLIRDASGVLYGTTQIGGTTNNGTVFSLTPPAPGKTGWTESILYSFAGGSADGSDPQGRLIGSSAGVLYGTTTAGGLAGCPYGNGCGTVFELTPPQGQGTWTESVLYFFSGTNGDGSFPNGGLIADSSGTLYGTTQLGGLGPAFGTVFSVTPPAPGKSVWSETVLYAFTASNGDGRIPSAGLIAAKNGALYSTTQYGGASGNGTVYQLTPPAPPQTMWTESVVYSFAGTTDGYWPEASLLVGAAGTLFGTTSQGGGQCGLQGITCGTAFKLTPPSPGKTVWTKSLIFDFHKNTGALPGQIIGDGAGYVYGVTAVGGGCLNGRGNGCGTVFMLKR